MNDSLAKGRRWQAAALMSAYVLIIVAPLALIGALRPPTDHGFVSTLGKNLALAGFSILALQFVLSARLPWIERTFGMDVLFRFHKAMAIIAAVLLLAHPLLMAAGGGGWKLLFGLDVPWFIWVGRDAMFVLLAHVTISACRRLVRLNYESWRLIHNLGALLILPLGFVHSWNAGMDLQLLPVKALWLALLGVAAAAYVWHRLVRPLWLRGQRYEVIGVQQETKDVWTIKLAPPKHVTRYDYLPGQFHYLTFLRDPILPVEEHHFTISSSPTEPDFVSSTIRESGDFTVSIGRTKVGDTAVVCAPFGRFSYLLHPEERDLVFIAGGIGITPLMSMLRHLRDTRATDRRVRLLYASSSEENIVFREELDAIQAGGVPPLEIVHVLNRAADGWQGETGRLDAENIPRFCGGDLSGRAFYICAPPELTRMAMRCLKNAGVPAHRIHFELFSL